MASEAVTRTRVRRPGPKANESRHRSRNPTTPAAAPAHNPSDDGEKHLTRRKPQAAQPCCTPPPSGTTGAESQGPGPGTKGRPKSDYPGRCPGTEQTTSSGSPRRSLVLPSLLLCVNRRSRSALSKTVLWEFGATSADLAKCFFGGLLKRLGRNTTSGSL